MSLETLIDEIGDDADLLTRSDEWLEAERQLIAASLDKAARELHAVQTAQRIKRALQQKNLVAVQSIIRSEDGDIVDILVRIMNLPDAILLLNQHKNDTLDNINYKAQIYGWNSDGYDINTSIGLKSQV